MSAAGAAIPCDEACHTESNTVRIVTVVTIFHALAFISVSLRLYARIWLIKAPGWDDWVMVLTILCALGGWIVFIIQSHYGLGKHQASIPKPELVELQHAGLFQSIISAALGIMFLKISISLNLLRLGAKKWYKWGLWFIIVFTFIQSGSGVFTFTFYCQPTARFWDKTVAGTCWPIKVFVGLGIMNTALNIFTDVVLATLPIPLIWNLQMKRKVRLYVIGILSLGYFAVAMGIVKAIYQIGFGANPDKTFEQSIQFWGFLQLQLGIIAACAPTFKPLVGRMLRLTSYDDYTNETPNNGSKKHPTLATIGGTGGTGNRRHTMRSGGTHAVRDQYELDDMASADSDQSLSNVKGATTTTATFYKHDNGDGSGSEERILHGGRKESARGIMKTTEVTVK
ncbi:hypothetical protein GCG54_00005355 [Colletotrichum gloeosporioides]|uniref:Rhodopsin domain-containing protein n=2 Tax=Colletotrichum gloeosporioides TaxID=474922 RepID=T0KN74_COLGC|nr:uncharacterized protein GCG54_00005355 [Colletotrichum gloeosporioides]EQB53454.1 hypothetical protein CGLO_06824 [Colletotrichum gloeosporioides Cg-14]KAF3809811.1 hypothetical protein GCG54_00005355 [Colletotrichum gloeosporioides]